MKVLVLGKGTSGESAAGLLRQQGHEPAFAEGYGLVVASPGVHVMSELEFGCRALRGRGTKMLAVTGSKGKSSVVKLVAEALCGAGRRAVPCGNYGLPVSRVAQEESPPAWAVVEVSSFMLETTNLPPDTFEAAVILNLQEDHLDRHGCVETYHALKRRLPGFAREDVSGRADASAAALLAHSYFDNDVLRGNGLAAIALLRVAGLADEEIRRGFAAFVPLPHRFQTVHVVGGVRYVDDSKATSLAALAAGVTMCGDGVRLIAGGLPKGDDPAQVLPVLTRRAKKVYLIGRCAEAFATAWSGAVDCEVCGTLDRAVARAAEQAVRGETVLLSPGAASFDQFENFGKRGEAFAELVKKGQKEI